MARSETPAAAPASGPAASVGCLGDAFPRLHALFRREDLRDLFLHRDVTGQLLELRLRDLLLERLDRLIVR